MLKNAKFVVADLFNPPKDWYQSFEFVLEVYTIQPLPIEVHPQTIDAIANFVELRKVYSYEKH